MVQMCNVISVVGVPEMAEPSIPFISTKKGSGRETRLAISGNVKLISKDGQQVEAELLDISIHGFRVRHAHPPLASGREFRVIYPWGEVIARVVWSRAVTKWNESGFLLCY